MREKDAMRSTAQLLCDREPESAPRDITSIDLLSYSMEERFD